MDCTTALTVQASLPESSPLVIPYSTNGATFTYANGWTTIFANADTTACPVTGCQLMNSDCSVVPTANVNFFMDSGSPWKLKYKKNIVNGWAA